MKSILNHSQKKKLRKLFRDPKQFLLDSPGLRPVLTLLNIINNRKTEESQTPSTRPIKEHKRFEFAGAQHTPEGKKPLVLLFGFHDWKKKIVPSFLLDYQVIYANGGCSSKEIEALLNAYPIEAFITWGINEDPVVTESSSRFMKPIWTMEDGFIRSVALGSNHTDPRSLVLDKSGIYFDSSRPSDVEDLLNNWSFEDNKDILDGGKKLFKIFKSLNISKYNPPNIFHIKLPEHLPMPVSDSVLVIGQLGSDASLRYGECKGLSNSHLIETAIKENPGKNIIYKPHPDELKHNKKHLQEISSFSAKIEISSEDESLFELFKRTDHVYTMTSLAGLEAAFRGLTVTVLGSPFYAGWGLTDDRNKHPRRKRKLSAEELFTIAYVVYPKYLANSGNPVIGCLSAMQLIAAERELELQSNASSWLKKSDATIYSTTYWSAMLLSNKDSKHDEKLKADFSNSIPYEKIFHPSRSKKHKRFLAYMIGGAAETSPQLDSILKNLRKHLDPDIAHDLLSDLWRVRPTPSRLENWAEFCEDIGKHQDARSSLRYLAQTKSLPKGEGLLDSAAARNKFKLASFDFRRKIFLEASKAIEELLLSGHSTPNNLHLAGQIAISQFEYELAYEIYNIIKSISPNWLNGHAHLMCARLAAVLERNRDSFTHAATGSYINPNQISSIPEDTGFFLDEAFGYLPFSEAMSEAVHACERGTVLNRASADISIGKFARAEKALESYKPKHNERDQHLTLLSQSKSYQGKTEEATRYIKSALSKNSSHILFREAFRLATQANDFEWTKFLLDYSKTSTITVSEAYKRKAATILGDAPLYYECLREMASSNHLKAHFGEKYIQTYHDQEFRSTDKNLVIAYFGPGDEIRWAALYPEMARLGLPASTSFTCDPRLLTLFSRSFPDLTFIPSKRTRNMKNLSDVNDIRELPSSDLFRHMDNAGWHAAKQADHVSLQVDLLADIIHDHEVLSGQQFLIPDSNLMSTWNHRISSRNSRKPKVGISWRSSVQSTSRNQYYLDIDQVASIISDFPEVDFYCLQYDDCASELEKLQSTLPGKLIYFNDIDYFNDFENVAALMKNMDLVISPGTSIIELSGALGIDSIFFCTTAELDWRYRKNSNRDVWYECVRHIKPTPLNDKEELVKDIKSEIRNFLR